ncbi:hypothetical protein [Pseudomonas sp. RIT-PI-AD]|nr:hypothetical protein [Pseudomonas sp. RIT-PI-AD]
MQGFTSTPRPLDGVPPFVWQASIRTPEFAEQAALQAVAHASGEADAR